MGIKYQVVHNGKIIKRTKLAWKKYAKKSGYELQVWTGKGSGWKRVIKSGG